LLPEIIIIVASVILYVFCRRYQIRTLFIVHEVLLCMSPLQFVLVNIIKPQMNADFQAAYPQWLKAIPNEAWSKQHKEFIDSAYQNSG